MAKSPTEPRNGKAHVAVELDSELAAMLEAEAASTPGGIDAFLEQCCRAGLKALN